MNYIIFDLELNSKPFKNRHPNEIIEIGAVKLNEDLDVLGTFQSFVKPKLYKKLFSVVKNKTHITQADVNNAEDFKSVITRFRQWIGKDYILCSWGHDDMHHLKSNCEFQRIGSKWIRGSIDIQKQFSRISGLPAGHSFSLKSTLERLEIPIRDELHRADIDALYTAEIFKRIYDKLDTQVVAPQNKAKKGLIGGDPSAGRN